MFPENETIASVQYTVHENSTSIKIGAADESQSQMSQQQKKPAYKSAYSQDKSHIRKVASTTKNKKVVAMKP